MDKYFNSPQATLLPTSARPIIARTETFHTHRSNGYEEWCAVPNSANAFLKSLVVYNKSANNGYLLIKDSSLPIIPASSTAVTFANAGGFVYLVCSAINLQRGTKVRFTTDSTLPTNILTGLSYYIGNNDGVNGFQLHKSLQDALSGTDPIVSGAGAGGGTLTILVLNWIEFPPIPILLNNVTSLDFAPGHKFMNGIYIIGSTSATTYTSIGNNLFYDIVYSYENM